MKDRYSLQALKEDWIDFLWNRGHAIKLRQENDNVVVTHDKNGAMFRWILFTTDGPVKKLCMEDRRKLSREINQARLKRQRAYVAAYFSYPAPKVIIQPADKVLQIRRINPARGGIDWYL